MQEFIQTYLNKLDVTAIIENILTKLLSLLFLFLLFYIAKKLLHTVVQRIVKPSLKMSRHDVGRQKTISRLLENMFNYTLYFFLLYCILSILGLPVSSLLAGAGIADKWSYYCIGQGRQRRHSNNATQRRRPGSALRSQSQYHRCQQFLSDRPGLKF